MAAKATKKANGKAKKRSPLLLDRRLPQTKTPKSGGVSFELSILPAPKLERESDIAEYLIEELPQWIDAIDQVVNPGDESSLTSTLIWDLRNLVQLVGCTLKDRRVPFVEREMSRCGRGMIVEAVSRCIAESKGATDAQCFLNLLAEHPGKPPEGCARDDRAEAS